MAAIEIYTGHDMGCCEECGAVIRKKAKRFQVVRGDGPEIDGPFCTQECASKYRDRADDADAEEKLHMAAADLLAACEAAEKAFDDVKFYPNGMTERQSDQLAAVLQIKAAIARAKS